METITIYEEDKLLIKLVYNDDEIFDADGNLSTKVKGDLDSSLKDFNLDYRVGVLLNNGYRKLHEKLSEKFSEKMSEYHKKMRSSNRKSIN